MSRYVQAPTISTDSGSVLGVSLNLNERVEWIYTTMPDGRRIVTGYDILPLRGLSGRHHHQTTTGR